MKTILIGLLLILLNLALLHAQSTASSQVSKFTIDAPQLNAHKVVWVYTPKSYKKSKTNYPVMYMFDAQNLFDATTSYAGEWKIDEYLDSISQREVIVVGIEHGNDKRLEELTPYPNDQYGGGLGNKFLDFMINTLKPHIDSTYRTKTDAVHTSIVGSSLGGLMAFYALIIYPDNFSKAGVFSPAFWINPEIYEYVATVDIPKSSRFYFMAGDQEDDTMLPNQQKMLDLLKEKGVPDNQMTVKVVKGGTHNEALWRSAFPDAFTWLFKADTQ